MYINMNIKCHIDIKCHITKLSHSQICSPFCSVEYDCHITVKPDVFLMGTLQTSTDLKTGLRVFCVDEPLSNYLDPLDHVKQDVPFFEGFYNWQIVISYEDLSLQTLINVDRNYS